MMGQIGQKLREARDAQGLSLEEIQRTTKIRMRYLEALEGEEWGIFPGEVYLKGFLKSYAQAVGLDPQELLQSWQSSIQVQAVEPKSEEPRAQSAAVSRTTKPRPIARPVSAPLASGFHPRPFVDGPRWGYWLASCGLVIVLACSWLAYSAYRAGQERSTPPAATPSQPANVAPVPTPESVVPSLPTNATQPGSGASATPAIELKKVNETPYEVRYEVRAVQKLELKVQVKAAPSGEADYRCWVDVQSDGQNMGDSVMTSGKSNTFTGSETIKIRLGNPQVVEATLNGFKIPQPTTTDAVDLVFIRQP